MDLPLWTAVLRLVAAAALGALIGLEREPTGRSAGMRTHAVVALGAAVFTLAGAYGFADVGAAAAADPARVAAQVATGVGFIGAGAILRHGSSVQGVTTAATVWLAAGVGVMASAGGIVAAAVATLLALAALTALRITKPAVRRLGRRHATVRVEYARGYGTLGPVLRFLADHGAMIERLEVGDDHEAADRPGVRSLDLHVSCRHDDIVDDLVHLIAARPEVRTVRLDTPHSGTERRQARR